MYGRARSFSLLSRLVSSSTLCSSPSHPKSFPGAPHLPRLPTSSSRLTEPVSPKLQ
ncbi:hypothetical protein VFPBJ_08727 [Purpureocillium lilacinum]|uniref:Uncharacterized protein n=1 Tax=Purpureocillium lilacinum TaxID=33203 RepID=A0A179GEU5_PURLI|nr:hypothetical protein VFPBJ_08727 [Purpureocillium lilacinum]